MTAGWEIPTGISPTTGFRSALELPRFDPAYKGPAVSLIRYLIQAGQGFLPGFIFTGSVAAVLVPFLGNGNGLQVAEDVKINHRPGYGHHLHGILRYIMVPADESIPVALFNKFRP